MHEIIAGLRGLGWSIRLIEPPMPKAGRLDSVRRAMHILSILVALVLATFHDRPSVVYIRSHFAAMPAGLILRLLNVPTVQELNGPVDDAYDSWPWLRRFGPLVRSAVAWQLTLADAVIVVTPELADYVGRLGRRRDRATVIGNGADPLRFRPKPSGDDSSGNRYVVFVGALASWQGIEVMIDATASAAWPSGVDLVIAGDGRERDRVLMACERHTGIRWLGTVPYRQSADLVAGSVAALIPKIGGPSTEYGLSPLKLFEAMASGVPVVVSELPGLSDVVAAHACGLVVPSGNPEALALAVRQLASDPNLAAAMGTRGRAAVESEYSWSIRAGQVDKVLLDLAARRAHGGIRPTG